MLHPDPQSARPARRLAGRMARLAPGAFASLWLAACAVPAPAPAPYAPFAPNPSPVDTNAAIQSDPEAACAGFEAEWVRVKAGLMEAEAASEPPRIAQAFREHAATLRATDAQQRDALAGRGPASQAAFAAGQWMGTQSLQEAARYNPVLQGPPTREAGDALASIYGQLVFTRWCRDMAQRLGF